MNPSAHRKLLVIDVAALSEPVTTLGLNFRLARCVFPALTCPVQASFRTASGPSTHGMVANGLYLRRLGKVMFWEQSARLVAGERIWSAYRRRGGKVAMLFWQQSLGEEVDAVLSPAPIHKHHGGMIEDCYCQPADLYRRLCRSLGRPFRLRHYWGPMASWRSGQWIAEATAALLREAEPAPDLCLTYLPTLDYDLQRHGPASPAAAKARSALAAQLALLMETARQRSYEVVIFGDYRIQPVGRAVFPNRALAQAGLLKTRPVKDMLYPDLHASRAFAVVDHQIAHVYVAAGAESSARDVLSQLPGVGEVMDRDAQLAAGVAHDNGGELLLVAEPGTWFAYPWWNHRHQEPDYAAHVDIHNKPGYDPCELFWGWPPGTVSRNPGRIHGSHGLAGQGNEVAWASTIEFKHRIDSIIDLARATRAWLDEQDEQ